MYSKTQDEFNITLIAKWRNKPENHLLKVPFDVRHFFPKKGGNFKIILPNGTEIITRTRRTVEDGGTWIWKNLEPLFLFFSLKEGTILHFRVEKSMEIYRLEIVK
jgi:hypothetical protein